MEKGDIVLVDVKHANGGYRAKIIHIGKLFARIKSEGEQWDIMINRLTPLTKEDWNDIANGRDENQ